MREIAEALVEPYLLKLLRQMRESKDEVLGGQLKPLMEVVQGRRIQASQVHIGEVFVGAWGLRGCKGVDSAA